MEKEIKCHLCGGTAVLKLEELKLDDGKIIIKDSPYYQCQKCKESFSTSEQMNALDEQIHTHFSFKRAIINAGRSKAVTFPPDFADYYGLKKGRKIEMIPQSQKEFRVKIVE